MSFKVVIPARYASTRLPGKPLAEIAERAMVLHVWERAKESTADQVIIATDDDRIVAVADQAGADVCLTGADHPSGTDRIAEVVAHFGWPDDVVVVNVQGDEPLIPAEVINQVGQNLFDHPDAEIATLATPISDQAEFLDPNAVKVVTDHNGFALYFSRAPIPHDRDRIRRDEPFGQRHLGIYAYRCGFLRRFGQMPKAEIEQLECLEQLRALYQGVKIHVASACALPPPGVDTPEDLAQVRALFG